MDEVQVLTNNNVDNPQFLITCKKIMELGKKKKSRCIRNIAEGELFKKFSNYFEKLCTTKDQKAFNNFSGIIETTMEICSFVVDQCRDLAKREDFRILLQAMKKSIKLAEEKKIVQRSILFEFVELEGSYHELTDADKKLTKQKIRVKKLPDNFRDIDLLPTPHELLQNSLNHVTPVLIKGPYDDVEHYLSNQFRLLREDYVEAMRVGLRMYRDVLVQPEPSLITKYRYESLRVYQGVHFEKCKCSEVGNIAYTVNFDPNSRISTNYEISKHFMHGSLLLFSRNGFQSFFCATIYHHSTNLLNSGKLFVTVEQNGDFREDLLFLPNITFTMVESDVFWEPYSLVLQVLKNYSEESFPMRQYLVDVSSKVNPPAYLHKFSKWDVFGHETEPLNVDTWPKGKEIGLDEHQYKALKTALTKEFCVIQGPPGTGKTFLGLKIVEILLANMDAFEFYVRNPILIICFTNHALDQFLEGILEFNTRIIRVGGQSRSELLTKYNFKEKKALRKAPPSKEQLKKEKTEETDKRTLEAERKLRQLIGRKRREASLLLRRIDKLDENLDILNKPRGILSFDCLEEVIEKHNKEVIGSDYALIMWLLDERESNFPPDHEANDIDFIENMKYGNSIDDTLKNEIFGELFKTEEENCKDKEIEENEENMTYGISVDGLGRVCVYYKKELDRITEKDSTEYTWAKRHLTNLLNRYFILTENLKKPLVDEMLYGKTSKENLLTLRLDHRWNTYFYWIEAKKKVTKGKISRLKDEYRSVVTEVEKYQQEEDASILESACVVGMTTTGGARYHSVLEKLKPSVVIVEEAAEVLEAHIVASLSKYTEHVILIGDHKQLKPSTAVYELSKTYMLDCSLFERIINNGMYCPVLKVQHRMRAEISSLISPAIYKKLQNHESVQKYESIKGVLGNVFFVDHTNPESVVEDSTSYKNLHEAEFVLELCLYLVNQGYDPRSITLLTTYAAQMQHLKQARTEKISKVRTCVVDEYQGEENDIIILSLVRSNNEGNIGFLRIENRVCVALSRAKKGFYLIGNMTILSRGSNLWQKIREKLEQNTAIGPKLTLRCTKHGTRTEVARGQDFAAVIGGGCNMKCGDVLPCNHVCTHSCHIADPDHNDEFACRLMCTRTLECGHSVTLFCSIKEYLCKEKVKFKSSTCKHTLMRECFNPDTSKIVCENDCKEKLRCGHECPRLCHLEDDHILYMCQEVCGKKNKSCKKNHPCLRKCYEKCGECLELVSFSLSCGHVTMLPCGTIPEEAKCPEICGKRCDDCGKPCQKQCWESCKPCTTEVKKMIEVCSHFVNVACSVAPTHEICDKLRTVYKEGACGHDLLYGVPCGISRTNFNPEDYLLNCEEPCESMLNCQHKCSGTCGQCMQGRLHVGCKRVCGVELICGHKCEYACEEVCPPCCNYTLLGCSHMKYRRRCGGALYTKCSKRCAWKCKHRACTMACGDFCNRDPCYEPCPLKLVCGHPCIGFCGEPCPPICRICDRDENIPQHARYIVLEDCGCVLESHAFEEYLDSVSRYIEMYRCPKEDCEKLITCTKRFMNRILSKYKQIVAVYKNIHGLGLELTNMRETVIGNLKELCQFDDQGLPGISNIKIDFLRAVYDKHDIINKQDMAVIKYFSELFNTIFRRWNSVSAEVVARNEFKMGVKLLSDVLNRVEMKALLKNKHTMNGFRSELIRMHRVFDYCVLLKETSQKILKKNARLEEIRTEIKFLIYKPEKFSPRKDQQLDGLFQQFLIIAPNNGHYSFNDGSFVEIKYFDFLSEVSVYHWVVCKNGHIRHSQDDDETDKCPVC